MEVVGKILCLKNLKKYEVRKFRNGIIKKMEYDMYLFYNNIILHGIVGFAKEDILSGDLGTRYYLITHIDFFPHYNENIVVDVSTLPDIKSAIDITEDAEIGVNFTYSVSWQIKNENANMKDSENKHSVMFFVAMFGMWLGLLSMTIIPFLWRYFESHHSHEVTLLVDGGQIQIHGDACRNPPHPSLLFSILGTGVQQFVMIIILPCIASIGLFNACDLLHLCQNMLALTLYCISSYFSGYFTTHFIGQNGKDEAFVHSQLIYVVPVLLTIVVANVALWWAGIPDSAAPLRTFFAWAVGTCIFTSLGDKKEHLTAEPRQHCLTRKAEKVVPKSHNLLKSTPAQMLFGGLLTFLTILDDMDEIYASFMFLKVCGAYFTLVKFFVCIIIMTTVMAIAFTSYQLYWEDFDWWWRSVFRGGSTAIFIFAYGIYFQCRIKPRDLGALFIFTCYKSCFCYGLFFVLGTISFYVSQNVYAQMHLGLHKHEV